MILMTGSVLVILENITKIFHPQPVNVRAFSGRIVSIQCASSLVIRKGQEHESILQPAFSGRYRGWSGCHPSPLSPPDSDWYILDRSYLLPFPSLFCQKPYHVFGARFQEFSWMPEGVDIQQVKVIWGGGHIMVSILSIFGPWMNLEKRHCPCLWSMSSIWRSVRIIAPCSKEVDFKIFTISG